MERTEQRNKLRAVLAATDCHTLASVFNPLSARIAQSVGYEIGLLWGSVVSSTTLAAPDLLVHTLTECADHVWRITRVSALSLIVDAEHGYGNALNVWRTVQELEHAGASGLALEDTTGPDCRSLSAQAAARREDLAACGVRIMLLGTQSVAFAVRALHGTYAHLFSGGASADLESRLASAQEMEQLVYGTNYKRRLRDYVR